MLCERPGCSEPSAVLFGFDAIDCRVWLEAPDMPDDVGDTNALCARHADSLVVPRGWSVDDRREAVPRLFRPPAPRPSASPTSASQAPTGPDAATVREGRRARRHRADTNFDSGSGDGQPEVGVPTQLTLDEDATVARITDRATRRPDGHEPDPDETVALPWAPVYDDDDDLDGLLDADGELLARAFRGADRPRRSSGAM